MDMHEHARRLGFSMLPVNVRPLLEMPFATSSGGYAGRHQFGNRGLKQIHSLLMTAEISTLTADARKSEKCLE